MDLKEIAQALVEGCRAGTELDNLGRLYAEDAVSVEAMDQGGGRETKGLEGIRGKHAWFDSAFEIHDSSVEGPFLHGDDRFAVIFDVDASEKATGERMPMREVGIYHVADGKIVREEFFYS
ncbi:nuclear transport factor 2 family protein [Cognatishimia sp. F0-27]|uniref:nuclear transport factor 2 family protein n=1 Tax=Cognatishimia sp. F0-27 TaxID=2816855 RepID=UPI001D0C8462|nr:nuclear transport factor 2 family protein [Cognatishimia sp. F0-27]MCC1493441.1 nuclear transport factor 2 family protein [Cognatishimia sp. F0-27]